jgi:hypothetical protein
MAGEMEDFAKPFMIRLCSFSHGKLVTSHGVWTKVSFRYSRLPRN